MTAGAITVLTFRKMKPLVQFFDTVGWVIRPVKAATHTSELVGS